jgi:hypothetical protein
MKIKIVGSVETMATINQITCVTPQKSIIQISFIIIITVCYTAFHTLKEQASSPYETLGSLYGNIWTYAPQDYVYSSFYDNVNIRREEVGFITVKKPNGSIRRELES